MTGLVRTTLQVSVISQLLTVVHNWVHFWLTWKWVCVSPFVCFSSSWGVTFLLCLALPRLIQQKILTDRAVCGKVSEAGEKWLTGKLLTKLRRLRRPGWWKKERCKFLSQLCFSPAVLCSLALLQLLSSIPRMRFHFGNRLQWLTIRPLKTQVTETTAVSGSILLDN